MNAMLSAVPTRFFRPYLAVLILHLSSPSVIAGEDDFFLKDLLKQQPLALPKDVPAWLKGPPAKLDPQLEQVLRAGNRQLAGQNSPGGWPGSGAKHREGRWIFVSLGMPEAELKAAAMEASVTQSYLVFRGVERGANTGSIAKRLYGLVKDLRPVPSAIIDPTVFTRFNVTAVPMLVEVNSQGETRQVKGLPGFRWLAKQGPGDLGQRGAVYGILEPDMIEEMKRRLREYDWDKEKQHAMDNFWANQKESVNLPSATRTAARLVDLSVVSAQDIYHPDGRLIVRQGSKVNPQALLPMRHAYLLFDARDKVQVQFVRGLGDDLLKQQKPVVYLFANMGHEKGWDHYNDAQALLNGPIYQLNQILVDRFKVKALPALIVGEGQAVKVTEFAVPGGN